MLRKVLHLAYHFVTVADLLRQCDATVPDAAQSTSTP